MQTQHHCHVLTFTPVWDLHVMLQVAALKDDLAAAAAGARPGTSGMSAALRQQVLLLQVGGTARCCGVVWCGGRGV